MAEKRTFFFEGPASITVEVDIQTTVDADLTMQYGHYTWRCAEALAKYLSTHSSLVRGKHVLELGSGTGLCGLVSALLGANHVTFTDADRSVEPNLLRNTEANQVKNYTFHHLDWNDPCYKWKVVQFDVLLAADCLFGKEVYEAFIRTASFLLHSRPDTFMLISIEFREDFTEVWILFKKYLLQVERLEDTLVDNVQVYRITAK